MEEDIKGKFVIRTKGKGIKYKLYVPDNVNEDTPVFVYALILIVLVSLMTYKYIQFMKNPEKLPDGLTISLAEHSIDPLEGTMKEGESKNISIKIINIYNKYLY